MRAQEFITETTTAGGIAPVAMPIGQMQKRIPEAKKDQSPNRISKSEDPCWSGYHMVGTKKKNGREVPNCVPGKKGAKN